MTSINLRQGLSVLQPGKDLMIGLMPPAALAIEDAPDYLRHVLSAFSRPVPEAEALATVTAHSDLDVEEAGQLLSELRCAGVLTSHWVDREERYSRHRLYFGVAGFEGDPMAVIRNSTVGLIGTGGIGSNVAMMLAAAGVGRLVVADADVVETTNLTRQFLYTEGDVGTPKVEALARRVAERNAEVRVDVVNDVFDGPDFAVRHFADCDLVILSADTPQDVHRWLNEASVRTGVPYTCAGYLDTMGIVGPLVVPGRTACLECHFADTGLASYNDGDLETTDFTEYNRSYQAPSYGPLNAMVSAAAVNDTLRFLLGLPVKSLGSKLLLDSIEYGVQTEEYERNEACGSCGTGVREEALSGVA
ncbi:ThiF family adenylyltransferase [Streptomyces sp. G2]|uniref:HesA/MoeB/ThiF family protein n=1 Tax=Streptomyces sp. G2 TaxID=1684471 RepID=UPI00202E8824|nr:ThiF family adenylyltransferase [Streptomyces sp. G2]MCM1946607.1 ThiF family adenylyltransferase [Streptomyces sp. G2]